MQSVILIMKPLILFLLIIALCGPLMAQNLVLNPGFEVHGETSGNGPGSDNLLGNHVKNWLSPTKGSPDYFLRNNDYLYNQYGMPLYYEGDAMAGLVVYGGKKEYREYIMGELSEPLEAGVTYHFTMRMALASVSGEMVHEFGVYFSDKKVSSKKSSAALKLIPQLKIDSTDKKELNGKWVMFEETYTALGGEKYFTIGNFISDNKTKSKKVNVERSAPYAYYYIDDVSITPFEEIIVEVKEPWIPDEDTTKNVVPEMKIEIEAGTKLVYDNIYFEVDKAVLKEESLPVLDVIIFAMKDQANLKVEIDGHTDSDGGDEHNYQLSNERAKAVGEYFMKNGIDASRITTRGFGSKRPIGADKKKNRRVEFVFSE